MENNESESGLDNDVPPGIGPLLRDDDVERLARRLTLQIRGAIQSYEALPQEEHLGTVRDNLAILIGGIARRESPAPSVLRLTVAASRRRAHYGVPVYDVLSAFGFVTRGLWEELRENYPDQPGLLVDLVGPLEEWTQAMSNAVVEAYVNESGSRIERERELRERLFGVLDGSLPQTSLPATLGELAFDLRRGITVFCWPREPWSLEDVGYLQRSGRQWSGVCYVGPVHDFMVLVSQDLGVDQLTSRILEVAGHGSAVGVSLARLGADGLAMGLQDAQRALRVATARACNLYASRTDGSNARLSTHSRRLRRCLRKPRHKWKRLVTWPIPSRHSARRG